MTISHWSLGPLGEKVHFDKVSFPWVLTSTLCKHITWDAVFAHLNLTSFEWNVTVPFYQWGKYLNQIFQGGGWAPSRVAQLEIHPLWTETQRQEKAGQFREKAGPCPQHISHSQSQETSQPDMSRKGSLEAKQESCQGMFYPDAFFGKILAKKRVCTRGRILRYTKYRRWTRQTEMIGQGKLRRNTPWKQCELPRGCDSGPLPSLPVCLSTRPVLFFLLMILRSPFCLEGIPSCIAKVRALITDRQS